MERMTSGMMATCMNSIQPLLQYPASRSVSLEGDISKNGGGVRVQRTESAVMERLWTSCGAAYTVFYTAIHGL